MSLRNTKMCDWHDVDALATASYQLYNGDAKDKPISLDLCQAHEQALLEIFKPHLFSMESPKQRRLVDALHDMKPEPMDALERRRMKDRDRHRRNAEQKRKAMPPSIHRGPGYWGPLEGKVMDVVRRVKTNMKLDEVATAAGLTKATTYNTLVRLTGRDLVTVTGGRGRYRRYHLSV